MLQPAVIVIAAAHVKVAAVVHARALVPGVVAVAAAQPAWASV